MKYLAKCKKTLYYNWASGRFGSCRRAVLNTSDCQDLFNNTVLTVSKKEQLAIIEDFGERKLKLHIVSGKS